MQSATFFPVIQTDLPHFSPVAIRGQMIFHREHTESANEASCSFSLSPELDKASSDLTLRRLAEEPALFLGPIVVVTNP
jgi:hypothetical protein